MRKIERTDCPTAFRLDYNETYPHKDWLEPHQ
ncbi:hypothetical protein V12B01_12990 [Vibrio splendidus 12B01]|nr:hypothetical protein V12B01_12990 [Vibrio splendidus 12B01]